MANGRSVKPPPEAPFGVLVSHLRRGNDLTGAKLGKILGWSQPKVSKIETGAVIPSRDDVERLIEALHVSADDAADLRTRAERSRDEMTDWRSMSRMDAADWQRDIGRLERESTELRVFHPVMLSGLLQTSEHARMILGDFIETAPARKGTASVSAAVSARLQRQEILEDPGKRFFFILPELVLNVLLSQRVDMIAQLARIRAVAQQDNVDVRVLTADARWPISPTNGFALLDDRYVVIDLFNTNVVARSESDVRLYRQVFETISDAATSDIEPTLAKYRRLYLEREAGR